MMRQICDLYIGDSWILPIHIELTVNLFEKWESYKAAASAISTISSQSAIEHIQILSSLRFPSGLLCIEKLNRYSSLILDYNRHLQWIILHFGEENKRSKKSVVFLQELQAITKLTEQDIFNWLLKLVRFEYKFKQTCTFLLSNKQEEMNRLRKRSCNVFEQIAILLSSTAIDHGNWNERLKSWVITLKDTVSNMDFNIPEGPQVLEHLRSKIDEVIELQADNQIVLKQYFDMINSDLEKLQALCLVNEEFLRRINEQTDSTYLWSTTLHLWTEKIENLLKEDALTVKFLLNKIAFSISNLLENVVNLEKRGVLSRFYHQKLELALRKIIQAIPRAIFDQLGHLHPLFSTDTACQVEKSNLKSLSNASIRRRQLAKKTYEITRLSLGISNMQMTHFGPIEIKPNELLFDGLKQELNTKLRSMLTEAITEQNYLRALESHRIQLKTFRDAFVFVCEHIGINGVSLWQLQLAEVTYGLLDAEKSRFEMISLASDKKNQPTQLLSYLIDVLLKQTNPRISTYLPTSGEWIGMNTQKLEYSVNLFLCIDEWLPGVALVGLQRLVANVLTRQMRLLTKQLEKGNSVFLRHSTGGDSKSIEGMTASNEFAEFHALVVPTIVKIGHFSVLYQQLEYVIRENAQSQAGSTHSFLSNFLERMTVQDQEIHLTTEDQTKYANFLKLIAKSGFSSKVVESVQVENYCRETVAACLFGVLIHYFSTNAVSNKKADLLDHFIFVKGLHEALKEFGVWEDFELLFSLTLIDTSVYATIRQLKNLHLFLPINEIPEALQK